MDDRLELFLDLLERAEYDDSAPAAGTSMRIPAALRDAAVAAVSAGLLPSVTEGTVAGLRMHLKALANRVVLDEHYRQHPEVRPERWEIAVAAAVMTDHPLAGDEDLIRRAAEGVSATFDDPTPEEILAYASGLAAGSAA